MAAQRTFIRETYAAAQKAQPHLPPPRIHHQQRAAFERLPADQVQDCCDK